jgi:hypothetical protein
LIVVQLVNPVEQRAERLVWLVAGDPAHPDPLGVPGQDVGDWSADVK